MDKLYLKRNDNRSIAIIEHTLYDFVDKIRQRKTETLTYLDVPLLTDKIIKTLDKKKMIIVDKKS